MADLRMLFLGQPLASSGESHGGTSMQHWLRFEHEGRAHYGLLEADSVQPGHGDPFTRWTPAGRPLPLAGVTLLTPCQPSKLIGLWKNFHAAAVKNGWTVPTEPLYFIKTPNCYLAPGANIVAPADYDGRVYFEAELGVVIGKRCKRVSVQAAAEYVLGFTCVNDVTALDLMHRDASFAHWTRAKSCDTFGPFGPVIATGLDPAQLLVVARIDGHERQNFPVSDMIFSAYELVSRLSHDMTLEPGDVISCGTSLGPLPMRPGTHVEIEIAGIGILSNHFVAEPGQAG
jgi:2-keto-4-pentenoate hydratase/2-oxohepta-3-ene-1,7-dioic acid hydratase in catechol pathway